MKVKFLILFFYLTFFVALYECVDRKLLLGAYYQDAEHKPENYRYVTSINFKPLLETGERDFFVLTFRQGKFSDFIEPQNDENLFFFQTIQLVKKQSPSKWNPENYYNIFGSTKYNFYFFFYADGIRFETQINAYNYIKYHYHDNTVYGNKEFEKFLAPNGRPFDVLKTLSQLLDFPFVKRNIYRNVAKESVIPVRINHKRQIPQYLVMNSQELPRITTQVDRRYFQPYEYGQNNQNPPLVRPDSSEHNNANQAAIIAGAVAGGVAANAAGAAAGLYYVYLKQMADEAKMAGSSIQMSAVGLELQSNANLFNANQVTELEQIVGNRPPAGINAEGETLPRIKEDPFTKGITDEVNNNNYKGPIDDYANENKVIDEDIEEDDDYDSNNNNYNKNNRQVKDTYYRSQPKVDEYRGDLKRKNIAESGVTEEKEGAPKKPAPNKKP